MHNQEDEKLDDWESKLEERMIELKKCQVSKQYKTCTQCSEFFQCNIRQSYIQAVYESMNKGLGGGFEF